MPNIEAEVCTCFRCVFMAYVTRARKNQIFKCRIILGREI